MMLLLSKAYRAGTYTDFSKDSYSFLQQSSRRNRKRKCFKIIQAKKQSRCFIPVEPNEMVIYDLKRMKIIDNLVLSRSSQIVDFCYCQNRQKLYLIVEQPQSSSSIKSTLDSRSASPSRHFRKSGSKGGVITSNVYRLRIYDVLDKETKIDNEVSGVVDLPKGLNWMSLDIDISGKYLAVSGYENLDLARSRTQKYTPGNTEKKRSRNNQFDGRSSISKIKNYLEIFRISHRSNQLNKFTSFVKSYPYDITKSLKSQKKYFGQWSVVKFTKKTINGDPIILTSTNLKFALCAFKIAKRDKMVDQIIPETLLCEGEFIFRQLFSKKNLKHFSKFFF